MRQIGRGWIRPSGDAAHKTLWGWLRVLRPVPIQEIVAQQEVDEHAATVSGWRHIAGRWFYRAADHSLMRANDRFIVAWHKLRRFGIND